MRKREFLAFSLVVFAMPFVSAAPVDDLLNVFNSIKDFFSPILQTVLGFNSGGDIFFASLLIGIIIFAVVWVALDRIDFFSTHRWVLWTISIVVAVISIRSFGGDSGIIQAIILPYSTFGIAISAGLPFLIYFFFIEMGFQEAKYRFFRKAAWIFFAVIFIGLWFTRYGEVKSTLWWIYPLTALAALILAWQDGTIQKMMFKNKLRKIHTESYQKRIDHLMAQLRDVDVGYGDRPEEWSKRRKIVEREIEAVRRMMER